MALKGSRIPGPLVNPADLDRYLRGLVVDLAGSITYASIVDKPAALGFIYSGTGTPEGAVTAPVGSMFLRTDGGAGTTLYVKESGAGDTGWIAK